MQAEDAAMPPPDKRPGGPWIAFLVGALIAVVAVVGYAVYMTGQPWRFEASVRYVGSLLYLSVFGSVTAFVVFYFLARRRSYTFAAYVAALTPPTAMILSGLTEQAHWGWAAFAGVALVLAGQVLLIRGTRS